MSSERQFAMSTPTQTDGHGHSRFEVLPLGRSEEEAAQLPEPARLAVTCSPKHGPDRSVEVAEGLRALGHSVTVHVAAGMVRDRGHLDELLAKMDEARCCLIAARASGSTRWSCCRSSTSIRDDRA